MSSSQNEKPFFTININGIRDFAWSEDQILQASVQDLEQHLFDFKKIKNPIVRILPPPWWEGRYSTEDYKRLPENSFYRQIIELTDWFPSVIFEFHRWCKNYPFSIQSRIEMLKKHDRDTVVRRERGMLRHPDKPPKRGRRRTNKGKPKMVSARNFERLERKWQRETVKILQTGRWTFLDHENFMLPVETIDWAMKNRREAEIHYQAMKKRSEEN